MVIHSPMTQSRIGLLALTALLLFTAAAAGGLQYWDSGDSGGASASGPEPVAASVPARDNVAPTPSPTPHVSVTPYHIPPEQLAGWLAAVSERERPLIEDGVLTFEEYQAAVLETVACFERAGVKVVHFPGYGRGGVGEPGPRLSSRGVYSYAGAVQGTPDKRPVESAAATAACKAGSAQVESLWAQHTAPSQVEMQAMRDYMAKCLRDAGATVPQDHASDAELKRAKSAGASEEAYWKCQFAAADAFEIDELPG